MIESIYSLIKNCEFSDILSLFAIGISIYALFQGQKHKVLESRPWFRVNQMSIKKLSEDKFRFEGVLVHAIGGPALNVRFKCNIKGVDGNYSYTHSALFPKEELQIDGPSYNKGSSIILDEEPVEWVFEFEDIFNNTYKVIQKVLFNSQKIKQVGYEYREMSI